MGGWAPFSDWFRYEVIARHGGWWVDADGISIRSLRSLSVTAPRVDEAQHVFCTERHRLDRRTIGAVAVPHPQSRLDVDAQAFDSPQDTHNLSGFKTWVKSMRSAGQDICLVTNSHFRAPRGSTFLRHLADQMRERLLRYRQDLEQGGLDAVRKVNAAGHGHAALPGSNIGMTLFQRSVRELLRSGVARHERPCVLHWEVFNPVDATDHKRMLRVLQGEEALMGHWIHTVHTFRQVRDAWRKEGVQGFVCKPRVEDGPLDIQEHEKHQEGQENHVPGPGSEPSTEVLAAVVLPAPTGSLLKRKRVKAPDAAPLSCKT